VNVALSTSQACRSYRPELGFDLASGWQSIDIGVFVDAFVPSSLHR
jgi:hypothetical protein